MDFPLAAAVARSYPATLRSGHRLLWMGWVYGVVGSAAAALAWLAMTGPLSVSLTGVASLIPVSDLGRVQIAAGFVAATFFCLLSWTFGLCWLQADKCFWDMRPRERLLGKLGPSIASSARIIGVLLGFAGLAWVIDAAVLSRSGNDSLPLLILGAMAVAFAPVFVRLVHLPAHSAITEKAATGPWSELVSSSGQRTWDLLLAFALQLPLLALICFAFFELVAGPGNQLIETAFFQTGEKEFTEYTAAVRSELTGELLQSWGIFVLVSGPALMFVASAQVAVIRSLIGVPGQGDTVVVTQYELDDEGKEVRHAAASQSSSDKPPAPDGGQFAGGPESSDESSQSPFDGIRAEQPRAGGGELFGSLDRAEPSSPREDTKPEEQDPPLPSTPAREEPKAERNEHSPTSGFGNLAKHLDDLDS